MYIGCLDDRANAKHFNIERKRVSNSILVPCQGMTYKSNKTDVFDLPRNRPVLYAAFRSCTSRNIVSRWGPQKGDILHLLFFESGALVMYQRMFKAAQNICYAEEHILQTFFGKLILQLDKSYSAIKGYLSEECSLMPIKNADENIARFVSKPNKYLCNHFQKRVAMACLNEVRNSEPGSSSVSKTLIPIETGTNVLLNNHIYASLFHFQAGYV